MINLFRKIRFSLLNQGKTSRYFKYAIGEIGLVVIGILIALRLNIWNDTSNQNIAFENLIEALEKELYFNIEESNYELEWGIDYMENYIHIVNDDISIDEYKTNKRIFEMIVTNKLDVIFDDIQVMLNKQDQFPSQYKVLIPHLKKFNNLFARYKASEFELENISFEYAKYLVVNEPWFGDKDVNLIDSEAFLKRLEFQKTSPIFKNFLKEHKYRYTESLRNTSGIKTTCVVLIAQIKKIKDNYTDSELKQELNRFNLKPFDSYNCDINSLDNNLSLKLETIYPLYNNSKSTAYIVWEDDTAHRIELDPGEFTTNSFMDRIQSGQLITLEDDNCILKFNTDINGYLLIEDENFQ